MQKQRRLKLAAVLMAMAMAAGCAATLLMGVGGLAALGTYKWVEGTMEKDYPRPMKETFDAAMEGARILKLSISSELYTESESKILAATQDGIAVKVELIARPNGITTVKIRFGMMGNADWSGYYHRQIMKILRIPDQP
jgi:hypothetical protein